MKDLDTMDLHSKTFSPVGYGKTKETILDIVNSRLSDNGLPCITIKDLTNKAAQEFVNLEFEGLVYLADQCRGSWVPNEAVFDAWVAKLPKRKSVQRWTPEVDPLDQGDNLGESND